jgi:hypothetical protein
MTQILAWKQEKSNLEKQLTMKYQRDCYNYLIRASNSLAMSPVMHMAF